MKTTSPYCRQKSEFRLTTWDQRPPAGPQRRSSFAGVPLSTSAFGRQPCSQTAHSPVSRVRHCQRPQVLQFAQESGPTSRHSTTGPPRCSCVGSRGLARLQGFCNLLGLFQVISTQRAAHHRCPNSAHSKYSLSRVFSNPFCQQTDQLLNRAPAARGFPASRRHAPKSRQIRGTTVLTLIPEGLPGGRGWSKIYPLQSPRA